VTLLLKNLAFTILVPGTVGVAIPLVLVRHRAIGSGPEIIGGTAALAVGGAIYAWCIWDFAFFGRGTPAPMDAPKRLVVRGPYGYVRNPMYLGVLTVILGWSILYLAGQLVVYLIIVAACFHLMVVLYEERRLQRDFGEAYEEYRRRVGRWLPGRPR
jgi:protein-S-isoprenylcysteine O-methyltransferase Ste14